MKELFVFGIIFLYFLPSIIGSRSKNPLLVFVFNLFLGWTVVGWVLALCLSLVKKKI